MVDKVKSIRDRPTLRKEFSYQVSPKYDNGVWLGLYMKNFTFQFYVVGQLRVAKNRNCSTDFSEIFQCQCRLLHSQHNYWYTYIIVHLYYMFQPKRLSSGTRALKSPLFFPPAMPPYTGQCLHIGSVLDGCIVLVMPIWILTERTSKKTI
jgi:hypothetical protein